MAQEALCNNSNSVLQAFSFSPLNVLEVHRTLNLLDLNKCAGPDLYFIKLAADYITEPLTYIFSFSLLNTEIPEIWKSTNVLSLMKRDDVNNCRPTSKYCV